MQPSDDRDSNRDGPCRGAAVGRWPARSGALLAALLLAALLASTAAGCGGGGGDPPAIKEAREILQRVVIRPDQLPEAMERTEASFTTNETLAGASENSEEELARLNTQGRILSFAVFYAAASESPIAGIQNTATLFEASAGASESFAAAAQEAREADWEALLGLDQLQTEEIERADLADDVVWIRNSGFQKEEGGSGASLIANDDVLILRGRIRGFARVLTRLPDPSDRLSNVDEVAALMAAMVANIDAVLADRG